jgi:hypothetical protein
MIPLLKENIKWRFLLGWIFKALHGVAWSSPLLPWWGWCLGFSLRFDLGVSCRADFTNVLRAAYTQADPKSGKRH